MSHEKENDPQPSGAPFRAGAGDPLPGICLLRPGYRGGAVFRQHQPVVSVRGGACGRAGLEYDLTMLDTGCRSEAFVFCLPLLAAFPAGISVLTDVRSGFIKEYLGRSGSRPYVVSKVILSVLSGGGGVLGGYFTAAVLMFMIYGPMEQAPGEDAVSQWETLWPQALVVFLAGAFFAMLAATLGTLR